MPHLKDKCFIIKSETVKDKQRGDLITVFVFIDFTIVKNRIKENVAKNYRTLYYTSIAHDIKTPVNGILGAN